MSKVDRRDPDCQHHSSDRPHDHLHERYAASLKSRVKSVVDAEKEQGHPSKQVQVGMGWHNRVIVRSRHPDAHRHTGENEDNR